MGSEVDEGICKLLWVLPQPTLSSDPHHRIYCKASCFAIHLPVIGSTVAMNESNSLDDRTDKFAITKLGARCLLDAFNSMT